LLEVQGIFLQFAFEPSGEKVINLIKIILQYIAISSFAGLTIVGIVQKDWNYGVGLNFSLVLLYIFLYLCPIK